MYIRVLFYFLWAISRSRGYPPLSSPPDIYHTREVTWAELFASAKTIHGNNKIRMVEPNCALLSISDSHQGQRNGVIAVSVLRRPPGTSVGTSIASSTPALRHHHHALLLSIGYSKRELSESLKLALQHLSYTCHGQGRRGECFETLLWRGVKTCGIHTH